ncbi:ParB/RepB/Spo0J family partition protein [uncultured Roseobacter sp.]|uniref:ParB/RepB/Spo0J family partition protein n=1 Tax=uncultured Roseobacter sp. TaxID=114847 RepID=UPI00260C02BB|nr:ParB/RepB/Spo0J family partition protein [uncultured Roseobacter sp.]
MTKRHDDIFDAVLSGTPDARRAGDEAGGKGRAPARFLKRGNAISDRLSGENEEKTLHWVDPARCRMWARHNRDYDLLTEETCSDLIEGIRAQGRQEFPAVVRRIDDPDFDFEVICGARRHFAVSWLRANNYPQFKYLIDVRDLSDEEAFRLADIENRDREDISDYERAVDYAEAVKLYYGGRQKAMAERLEVSEVWLSRYLELARLPQQIVAAFPTVRDLRELHARTLKPLLKDAANREALLKCARSIAARQDQARAGQGGFVDAQKVMSELRAVGAAPKPKTALKKTYAAPSGGGEITLQRRGKKLQIEVPAGMSRSDLEAAFARLLDAEY